MKKSLLLAGCLALFAAASAFAETTITLQGSGTAESPYLVQTAADVLNICENTLAQQDQSGVYFKQTADIDLSGETSFYGIGAYPADATTAALTYAFAGVYDGGGYSVKLAIDGVKFDDTGKALSISGGSRQYVGFFGALKAGAVVKNLTVKGSVSGYTYVGGVIGNAVQGVTVDNCRNEATVTSYYTCAAGILAQAQGTTNEKTAPYTKVTNCINVGTINCNGIYCGGITGYNYANVDGCANLGTINCKYFNSVRTTTAQTQAGGIVGVDYYGSISNCVNAGQVYCLTKAGGILGQLFSAASSRPVEFKNCVSYTVPFTTDPGTTGIFCGATSTTAPNYATASGIYGDAENMGSKMWVNGDFTGMSAVPTAQLTTSTLPEGYSEDMWTCTAGSYPVLKAFQTDLAAAAATYLKFTSGTATEFASEATICPASATATLAQGTVFSVADGKVKVGAATAITNDTLAIVNGDYTRYVALMKVPTMLPNGDGTAANPWVINNTDEWNQVASFMSDAGKTLEGEYVKLAADLDFAGVTFSKIGDNVTPFAGHFDGQGKTISNVKYGADASGNNYIGLFGYIAAGGEVKNFVCEKDTISAYQNKGIVAGYCAGTIEQVEVNNCVVYSSNTYTGGVVGQLDKTGVVKNVTTNGGVITNPKWTYVSSNYTGGIVGCTVAGTADQHAVIDGCVNGTEFKGYNNVGGILGQANAYTEIKNCANVASVGAQKATPYVGGIIGNGAANSKISGCLNAGNVTALNATGTYVGGIAGNASSTIEDCYNIATVKGSTSDGGILGYNASAVINRCYNQGTVDVVTASGCGNIAGNMASGSNNYAVSGTAFDKDTTAAWDINTSVKALAAENWGTPWVTTDEHTLPMLAAYADLDVVKVNAAVVTFKNDSDAYDNVNDLVYLGMPEGLNWTIVPMNYSLEGNTLRFTQVGTYVLVATSGNTSKTYTLVVKQLAPEPTAVTDINAENNQKVIYYNIHGQRVDANTPGVLITNTGKKVIVK